MSQHETVKSFDRVKTLRARLGLTQPQLAQKLRISANYVYQIESGRKPLVGRTLEDVEKLEHESLPSHMNPDSVKPGVEFQEAAPEYLSTDEWKARAMKAEAEVKRLRLVNRLLTNEGINSNVLDDLMETLTQADRESLQQSRSRYSRNKAAAPATTARPDESTAPKKHST